MSGSVALIVLVLALAAPASQRVSVGKEAMLLNALCVTATKTDAIIGDDGDNRADPGEIIEYTVTINANGADALGITFDDTSDANTTFVSGSTAVSPVAVNDTFPGTVLGNVSIIFRASSLQHRLQRLSGRQLSRRDQRLRRDQRAGRPSHDDDDASRILRAVNPCALPIVHVGCSNGGVR